MIVPETGKIYKCKIAHWNKRVTKKHIAILKKVDEDDVSWRFEEDDSELSYDWHVEKIESELII